MAISKHNVNVRRKVALDNLEKAKFFEKKGRTEEDWRKRVDSEIETLKKRIR